MLILDTPYKKVFLLLTLFVGGLVCFLVAFFMKIFLTNVSGKSVWPDPKKVQGSFTDNLRPADISASQAAL